jgi:ABC-type transport system involved in multi-copper enzyme maturation permease subunit
MRQRRSALRGQDGFRQLLQAEWTKLGSLRSTAWCLVLGVVLMILLSTWVISSSKFYGDLPAPTDTFSFVHRSMSGDGSVVARVTSQQNSNPWAKAGIMIKDGVTSGSSYAAVMVTPGHGVRLEANFTTAVAGGAGGAPRWLKLTRSSGTITGFESTDGSTWTEVGRVTLDGLPVTVEVGMFVCSPFGIEYVQGGGAVGASLIPTIGAAVFDRADVTAATSVTEWTHTAVAPVPPEGAPQRRPGWAGMSEVDGAFTVTGDGDIAWYGIPSFARPDARDVVSDSLQGVQIGLVAIIVLGVLSAAGEYKTGMIRTTLAASPRRGGVLAAKATILGGVVFAASLVASTASFLATQPILRARGMRPPAYAYRSLFETDVMRAVIGTAAFLALLAIFALAVGVLLRRSSRAIPVMIAFLLVPQIVSEWASLDADKWLHRLTPAAGLAIQQTTVRFDTAISPWGGLAVLVAYTAAALAAALWRLRRSNA